MKPTTNKMILEFSKCKIPIGENEVKGFLIERIKSGKSLLKYFGNELDGSIECNEGNFLEELEQSTIVHLYFDREETASINYKMDKENVFKMVLSVLEKNNIKEIGVEGRNVNVYIG